MAGPQGSAAGKSDEEVRDLAGGMARTGLTHVDADDAIDADLKDPGGMTDPGLAFDTWRTVDANRPALVTIRAKTETDGSSTGQVFLDVDESGGTTADYSIVFSLADSGLGAGGNDQGTVTVYLPAGGQFQVRNANDPNAGNVLGDVREAVL